MAITIREVGDIIRYNHTYIDEYPLAQRQIVLHRNGEARDNLVTLSEQVKHLGANAQDRGLSFIGSALAVFGGGPLDRLDRVKEVIKHIQDDLWYLGIKLDKVLGNKWKESGEASSDLIGQALKSASELLTNPRLFLDNYGKRFGLTA